MTWKRPVPLAGDITSAAERSRDPTGWAFPADARQQVYAVIAARRDVRRFRPDPVDEGALGRLLAAAHAAPSVGHSQPWRFVVVTDPAVRDRAAWLADEQRQLQAAAMEPEAGRHLLDLQLEGIREAPMGLVVCCDRRVAPAGVLGRATFVDADLWSCACAIENLWLAARAEGLGLGWVTLFRPEDLAGLLGLPEGVVPLGWLCLGWPDERPPDPGLERAGWSKREPLAPLVFANRWPDEAGDHRPSPPVSRLRAPDQPAVVAARDSADELLTPPGSLGGLDRALDRLHALGLGDVSGRLVLAVGRHPVANLGVSMFDAGMTDEILAAATAGEAVGVVAAAAAGLGVRVVDAGASRGNLVDDDALLPEEVRRLVEQGRAVGADGPGSVVALGEAGIGNTTVSAALAAVLLGATAAEVVGRGASADTATVERKREVVARAVARARSRYGQALADPWLALAAVGGPEIALLAGVTLGAAEAGRAVILDGLATSVAALAAAVLEPPVAAHLVAGQRSREVSHPAVLARLGLEPLLDLRFRAGEGVGACLAAQLLRSGLEIRDRAARTRP